MNQENMLKVAQAIEDDIERFEGAHFKMATYGVPFVKRQGELTHSCGTAGCIAGWAARARVQEVGPHRVEVLGAGSVSIVASTYLGIDQCSKAGNILFAPNVESTGYSWSAFQFCGAVGDDGEWMEYGGGENPEYITPAHAVAMLRYCVVRGDIQDRYWKECLSERATFQIRDLLDQIEHASITQPADASGSDRHQPTPDTH